jgi:Spy/CpxP family protein refolding chaperone
MQTMNKTTMAGLAAALLMGTASIGMAQPAPGQGGPPPGGPGWSRGDAGHVALLDVLTGIGPVLILELMRVR